MTHSVLKKKVIAEIDVNENLGDRKIYAFVKNELLNGDEEAADEFMLSSEGGYTNSQLKSIKSKINYFTNHSKSKASCRVQAF